MKQKILEFDWDALIKREPDIDKACINFTNVILSVSEECIPRREVTIKGIPIKFQNFLFHNIIVPFFIIPDDENKTLPDFDDRGGNVLETIWVREEEIIDIISILDSNKATGPDKISNKIIISIKNEIAKPLCLLFNKSLRLKKYPRSWKIAHVIPLEIISMISSSLTQIFSSTLPPLSSKSGKVLFSSTKLVIEQKYLFKTSAFSLPS
jgi:hypothetical protein